MYLKRSEGLYVRVFHSENGKLILVRHAFGLIPPDKAIILSQEASFLLGISVGIKISKKDLMEKYRHFFGKKISATRLNRIIAELKKTKLLADKKTELLINRLKDSFSRKRIRSAIFGGVFYPDSARDICTLLKNYINRTAGTAGHFAPQSRQRQLKAIIVPHSNLEISGECAAHAYNILAHSKMPDTVIILGPQHSGLIRFPQTVLKKDFRTALGTVKVDRDFCDTFAHECGFDTYENNIVHETEHSIELQLLFLQYIFGTHIDGLRIVPILVSPDEPLTIKHDVFIDALKKTIAQSHKRIFIIATGDLVHGRLRFAYGNCRDPLVWRPNEKKFHACNKKVIALLKNAEPKRFLKKTSDFCYSSVCGRLVFYALLKLISPAEGELLHYTWTKNVEAEQRKAYQPELPENVGFVSMAFFGKTLLKKPH